MLMNEKTITVNGLTFAIKQWGKHNNDNPVVIALHGWLDNANSFDLIAPFLKDIQLLAIDLPGHGKSSHIPASSFYHFIDGVSHVIYLIETLGLDKCTLLGHSLGACIASIVASSIPNKISHLALIEGLGPLTAEDYAALYHYQYYLKKNNVLFKKNKRIYDSIEKASQTRAKKGYLAYEHCLLLNQRGLKKQENGYQFRHDERLLLPSPIRLNEKQVLSFLQNIQCPTCLVSADNGFSYDKENWAKRCDSVKHLQHHLLLGGHHVHMEKPAQTAEILNAFFHT